MKIRVHQIIKRFTIICWVVLILISCKKNVRQADEPKYFEQTNANSSELVIKWLDLQNQILLQPQDISPGFENFIPRFYSAVGISLYESVVPGMRGYQSLYGQLVDMPAMPAILQGTKYHWGISANASLATIFKSFLSATSAANTTSIDSLENALNMVYKGEVDASTFDRSKEFGKTVAQLIFNWSQTDGTYNLYPAYVAPIGAGFWVPTPPAFSPARGVHFGDIRTNMPGVLNENLPPAPVSYSTDITSSYYAGMKEVYDTKQLLILKPELAAQANYWRGTQGGSGYVLWYNILRKVLTDQGSWAMLDKAALAYCKMGIVHKDAAICSQKAKYYYNQMAPITYVRTIMGYNTWNSVFAIPAHPGYPEIHSPQFSSSAAVLSQMFGKNFALNTNGISDLPGYYFNSFEEASEHGIISRFYSGIATKAAVDAGKWIGSKTVEYMNTRIKFLK